MGPGSSQKPMNWTDKSNPFERDSMKKTCSLGQIVTRLPGN
jgi:hypothetical protein